ncbi:LPS export ABC transporter permease LptF [Agarivorans sp. MS3-6]|uniref:LPS export ABC transporter permease LptF n=1 Tax=Agarivorans sp. TSD2052 TaxID=2937286 RepID=UPI00200F5387|nr:LPS export ABC transporter permease LptF [Agarivorans sp. TSD2052]UPW19404.1 LPS export ABC transporter permease LptF [Agarivorans sp. TSD2052]
MLIFRYLFKETAKTQLAVLAVLLLIFTSQKFVRVLGQAAEGNVAGEIIAKVMLLNMPAFLILILPISMFLGVLVAHGRLYADSEMVVLQACGYSTAQLLRDTLILALFSTAAAGFNTLYLSPYTNELEQKLFDQMDAEAGISVLVQGRFESLGGGVVTFVEQIENKGQHLEKVFVAHTPSGDSDTRPSVVMAAEGGIERRTDGSQWMVLTNGKRYEKAPEQLDYSVLHFERYRVYLRQQEGNQSQRRLWSLPTRDLWGATELTHIAELQWRISLPLTIPILTFMVVPLAAVNPRQGRYAKLLPAILLYLSYYLMLSAARSGVEDGSLAPHIGLWSVHLLMLVIALAYLFIRSEYYLKMRGKIKGKACVSNS